LDERHDTYERLIAPVEGEMVRAVWRVVQDADDADDAFQDATARIWGRIDQVRTHPNPRALVLRICITAARDVVRRRLRHARRSRPLEVAEAHAGPDHDPSARQADGERRAEVVRALARLPERQAVAVATHYLLDWPFRDVAAALECAEPTARVHATRGIARLRVLLGEQDLAACKETP
jgi:RNA polymerase sigma factor (sigma-70 family)